MASLASLASLASQIRLKTSCAICGFGRRLYHDQIDQAVAIVRQVKAPVKVTWTREEDIQHDVFRGAYAHRIRRSSMTRVIR